QQRVLPEEVADLIPERSAGHVGFEVRLEAVTAVRIEDAHEPRIKDATCLLQPRTHLADNATVEDGVPRFHRPLPIRANFNDLTAELREALRGGPRAAKHLGV